MYKAKEELKKLKKACENDIEYMSEEERQIIDDIQNEADKKLKKAMKHNIKQ